jgi:IS5 family transposase
MGRNHLAGRAGDAINALMAAIGYNFRLLLAWIAILLSVFQAADRQNNQTENHRARA